MDKRANLFKKFSLVEASQFYDIKVTLCKNGRVKITNYLKPLSRLKKGFEPCDLKPVISKLKKIKASRKKCAENKIRSDSLARSRNMIIDYSSQNEHLWLSFITLTFAENVSDIDFASREFNKYISKVRRIFPDFAYLGVPEFQKRGAVHYHLFTNLQIGSDLLPMQKDTENMYDVKYWKHGFTSAFDIKNNVDDKFNSSLYMLKYLYKDLDNRFFGRKKVLKSNNLEKPNIFYLNQESKTYKNAIDYIKKRYPTQEYCYIPDVKYQVPSLITTAKLNDEDVENTLNILSSEL